MLRRRMAIEAATVATLSACLAEDPVVAVRGFPGKYAIGGQSDLFRRIALSGSYEPELVAICRDRVDPDRDVVDVGANVGLYTVLFADLAPRRRTLAIEPTAGALARLRRNVAANGADSRVDIFEGVVSDRPGELQLSVIPGREEYSSLGAMDHPSVAGARVETMTTVAATVDALVAARNLVPGFVKIDVEGMEHLVLRGMTAVLQTSRPLVLAELSDPLLRSNGSSAREVIRMMQAYGYEVTDAVDPQRPAGERSFGDMLCVPQ